MNSKEGAEEMIDSPYGTLEKWTEVYQQEINQFHNNNSELGEQWFGKDIQKNIVNYILKKYPNKSDKIFDIGFGNGSFLYQMGKRGYNDLYGIDYCEPSIQLAKEIFAVKEKKYNTKYNIKVYMEDINNKSGQLGDIKFDLIHDKGSLDAFLLCKDNCLDNYIKYVLSYSKKGTIFVISSCNNTSDELKKKFTEERGFKLIDRIKNRTFSFGGQTGERCASHVYEIII